MAKKKKKTTLSGRNTTLSLKARESEIQKRRKNVEFCINKFNREFVKPLTADRKEKLTDLVLTAVADHEILRSLLDVVDHDLEKDIRDMKVKQKALQQADATSHCSHSGHSGSTVSEVLSRIENVEIDIELESRHEQAKYDQQLRELENKMAAIKLQKDTAALKGRKRKVQARNDLLGECDLDTRNDVANALQPLTSHTAHEQTTPKITTQAVPNPPASHVTTASDIELLANTIAKSMRANRYAAPEPRVYAGNPLEYTDWEISLQTLIDRADIADCDKIHYLKQYVSGPAAEAISGYFYLNTVDAYRQATAILKERFGSPYIIAQAFKSKLNSWPRINNNDNIAVQKFADFLRQCEAAKVHIPGLNFLDDSDHNMIMMNKLPAPISNRWRRVVVTHRKAKGVYPDFKQFAEFVSEESDILNDPVLCQGRPVEKIMATSPSKIQAKGRSVALVTTTNTENSRCLMCGKSNHKLAECYSLAGKSPDERKEFVGKNKLCFRCLQPNHRSADCKMKIVCKKCQKGHATAMHIENYASKAALSKTNIIRPSEPAKVDSKSDLVVAVDEASGIPSATVRETYNHSSGNLSSMAVPVWLSSQDQPANEILVYALLDTMSDTTFVTTQAANQLGAKGKLTSLKLSTMTSQDQEIASHTFNNLVVRGYNSQNRIRIPLAYTRDSIPLDRNHISSPQMAKQWHHLRSIAHEIPDLKDCHVGMLIGYDASEALIPLRSITGSNLNDPFAVETPLGWSIVGRTNKFGPSRAVSTCHRVISMKNHVSLDEQHKTVNFMYKTDNQPPHASTILDLLQQDFTSSEPDCMYAVSQDDKQFVNMLSQGIKQTDDGHYSMPLPFKTRPSLPNNRSLAEKRLELLRRKLVKDENYRNDYLKFMNEIIKANDAEPVPGGKVKSGERWYIPHFGVYHPKKRKIRVVFDCAAQYQQTCLNDHLLQGPDFMNNLVGILHRFRKGKIAVMCDIQRMFHMFRVHESDRDYLRFLWFTDDSMTDIAEYRMTVHLFGAKSSPGCATYGLRTLASEHANLDNQYDMQAVQFVKDDFYVDDGLLSVDSKEQAIGVINSAIKICAKGNVRLHKFVCNEKSVLKAIPESEYSDTLKNLDLQSNTSMPIERALGVQWCIENDQFQFKVTMSNQPATRRGVLSTIASVFDPLGFLSPFILRGKQILQDMCRQNVGWDDPLGDNLLPQWLAWRHDLISLDSVKIRRCLTPLDFGTIVSQELHHFSDASTVGYGQCSYLRVVNSNGHVHCSLLCGKSRVAPLKPVTIPRLELQAALVSAKMAKILKSELKLAHVTREIFWTDSRVTLGYIRNDARKFHAYVANRVQQIRDLTDMEQWQFINTHDNPADIASRGLSVDKLKQSCWFDGPAFLQSDNDQLDRLINTDGTAPLTPDDPEVKANCHVINSSASQVSMVDRLKSFSTLDQAVRAVSRLKRLARLGGKVNNPPSVSELQSARSTIIKWAQQDAFSSEINHLISNETLPKTCSIHKLSPFIDNQGLLRVGGRLENSSLPFDEVHPIILPKRSHVTNLVIDSCHKAVQHQGRGLTMAETRSSGYWVIGCSSVVSSHINSCVVCRRQRRPTETQQMASLPVERTSTAPPFSYVGCDCFGPIIAKDNRKECKRYGVIFTCMASRAVHIELVNDLSTDSFINTLRCFIAIRGPIRQLRSDRGTNFAGAANELAKALQEGSSSLNQFCQSNSFDFVFNTPNASHMGGVWERQIRTIRSVLNSMLASHKSRLDSVTLRTFLYEAMAIINCRPIGTCENSDDKAPIPLSPNMLLTMKSKVIIPPPGQFDSHDMYSRKRWRQVQSLANTFWSRWKSQYLQSLQPRQKWQRRQQNIEVGDIVIVRDDNSCRNRWPLARVIATSQSSDGAVRSVKLQIADASLDEKGKRVCQPTVYERPIHKIVVLCESADKNT